jgi:putative restriction endonuclease
MDASTLLSRLEKLRVWSRGNERAPHKPLLLLHALARIERGQERVMKFAEVKGPLEELLREFGPTRKQTHPEYPFWRLENDGIWEVEWPRTSQVRERGQSEPSAAYLLREDVAAGFSPEVQELLESEPALRRKAASVLLARCYPSTYHEDILASVGLEAEAEWESVARRVRDPGFRHRVLDAWGRRCGVCSFDVTLGTAPACSRCRTHPLEAVPGARRRGQWDRTLCPPPSSIRSRRLHPRPWGGPGSGPSSTPCRLGEGTRRPWHPGRAARLPRPTSYGSP